MYTILYRYSKTGGSRIYSTKTWINQLSSSCWSFVYIFYRVPDVLLDVTEFVANLIYPVQDIKNIRFTLFKINIFYKKKKKKNRHKFQNKRAIFNLWTNINVLQSFSSVWVPTLLQPSLLTSFVLFSIF